MKADIIHATVNHRSDIQEEKIKSLLTMLFDLSEKRVEDQKDAAVKVVEATATATTAVQDTIKNRRRHDVRACAQPDCAL